MLDRYVRPESFNQTQNEQSRMNLSRRISGDIGIKSKPQKLDQILNIDEEDEEDVPLTPEEIMKQQIHELSKKLGIIKQSSADVIGNTSTSAPFNPIAKDHFSNKNLAPDAAPPGQFFFDNVKNNQVNGLPNGYDDYENKTIQAGQFSNSTPQQQTFDNQEGSGQWVAGTPQSPQPIPTAKMSNSGKMAGQTKFKDPYMLKSSALYYDPRFMQQQEAVYPPEDYYTPEDYYPPEDYYTPEDYYPPERLARRGDGAVFNGPADGGKWVPRGQGENWNKPPGWDRMQNTRAELSGLRRSMDIGKPYEDMSSMERIRYQRNLGEYRRKQKQLQRWQSKYDPEYQDLSAPQNPRDYRIGMAQDRVNKLRGRLEDNGPYSDTDPMTRVVGNELKSEYNDARKQLLDLQGDKRQTLGIPKRTEPVKISKQDQMAINSIDPSKLDASKIKAPPVPNANIDTGAPKLPPIPKDTVKSIASKIPKIDPSKIKVPPIPKVDTNIGKINFPKRVNVKFGGRYNNAR